MCRKCRFCDIFTGSAQKSNAESAVPMPALQSLCDVALIIFVQHVPVKHAAGYGLRICILTKIECLSVHGMPHIAFVASPYKKIPEAVPANNFGDSYFRSQNSAGHYPSMAIYLWPSTFLGSAFGTVICRTPSSNFAVTSASFTASPT